MNALTEIARAAVTTDAGTLLAALTKAKPLVQRDHLIPILSHVLLTVGPSGARLEATNLDASLHLDLPGHASGEGGFTLPLHRVLPALEAVAEDTPVRLLSLGEDGCDVRLHAGPVEMRLPGFPACDMPAPPNPPAEATGFALDGELLQEALDTVWHAISREETRYYLNGVYLHRQGDALRAVATDGHRMMWRDLPLPVGVPEDLGDIIPAATVRLLRKLLAAEEPELVTVTLGGERRERCVLFQAPGWSVATKTIDGTFPSYMTAVPKPAETAGRLEVRDPEALSRCLAGVIAGDPQFSPVALLPIEGGGLELFGGGSDLGRACARLPETVGTCTADWTLGEGGLNGRYLRDICAAMPQGFALAANANPEGPVTILPLGPDDTAGGCLMPMRNVPAGWEG